MIKVICLSDARPPVFDEKLLDKTVNVAKRRRIVSACRIFSRTTAESLFCEPAMFELKGMLRPITETYTVLKIRKLSYLYYAIYERLITINYKENVDETQLI